MKTSNLLRIGVTPPAAAGQRSQGFALVESMIGMVLVSLTLGCLFAANSHLLGLLKQGKEGTFATQMIQERMNALRGALWDQITDPSKLGPQLFAPATVAGASLPGATETIKVEPLTNPTNVSGQCVRISGGTVSSTGAVLTSQQSVKVTVSVQWNSRSRTRLHAATTVLTNGGI